MRILEPSDRATESNEIHITIDVPKRYAEMIEIHRESENMSGFVRITSVKMFGPQVGFNQDNTNVRRLLQ